MRPFERIQVSTLRNRLSEPPNRIIALFGPRQTGKTTIVRQALRQIDRESRYLAVDQSSTAGLSDHDRNSENETFRIPGTPPDAEWLIQHWVEARIEAERNDRGYVLVVDEIQEIPRWSEIVKGLWDADRIENRPLHVVIICSAPLLMQSGLSESLAGRFEPIFVSHWSFDEMARAFDYDLPMYFFFGGYPGSAPIVRNPQLWREYVLHALVNNNIDKDILAMQRVDKPATLYKLFALGAAYSGEILSYNKMLGQLQDAGNTTTLARYLDLLTGAGLLAGLQNFARRSYRRRASSPKLITLNTALMTVGSGYSFDEAKADRTFWGRIVESAVGAHLFNTATPDIGLYYWRESPYEVDFVLQRGPRIIAIEVKSGTKRRQLQGMKSFNERFSPQRSLLVGEDGIPLNEFLTVPAHYWFDES